jgi:hypothetical protein
MSNIPFNTFLNVANDVRKVRNLRQLLWEAPKGSDPVRVLIPDDQVNELKIALKQDWERVRTTWARNDAIREEAARRESGESLQGLDEEGERLLMNWQHFHNIQKKTGMTLPSREQLLDGCAKSTLCRHGLEQKVMRSIQFPTVEDADIAYHLALMNSGWNPSTLSNLNSNSPFLVATHPKDDKQLVLSLEEEENAEVTMQGGKPRAGGKVQFCTALAKDSSSPPVIVEKYLKRIELLREQLKHDYTAAVAELSKMRGAAKTDKDAIHQQYNKVQRLSQGCGRVWLYVNTEGKIRWIEWRSMKRFSSGPRGKQHTTHLAVVIDRLNARRVSLGKRPIAKVTPSDFRDIFARWVYKKTNGNIIAVMIALGHSRISSTVNYVENNIFTAENDGHARRFMTHLLEELRKGRVDLTILAQLVRHGPLTPEMETRLVEYRNLMKSRIGAGCADPLRPPEEIAPNHVAGRLCGTHRCLKDCQNAKFLPESLDGIAMRVEELVAMSDHLPRETWLRGEYDAELEVGEYLLETLYPRDDVTTALEKWRERIASGEHLIPGLGRIAQLEEAV